jgi:hypothetical protein
MSDILAIIAKHVEANTGKSVEDVLKETEEAEIRGEKVLIPVSEKKQEAQTQLTLPFAGDGICAVPNSALRSALFGAIKRGKRKTMFREKLASSSGVSVVFSGFRLDQADLDVWQRTLHISRESLGQQIRFTSGSLLRAIGRNTSGASHEWLKDSMTRLQSAVVEITDGSKTFSGQLIHNYYVDEVTRECVIELNPKLSALFEKDSWTGLEWDQRKQLMGKPLALWLHGFYSTHSHPFDYKIETLWRLCGSEAKELKEFRRLLLEALPHLCQATGWNCRIDDDKLQVFKSPEQMIKRLAK